MLRACSEEEKRALSGAAAPASASTDISELRKCVIAAVPTTPEAVLAYALKWDCLRLETPELRDKVNACVALVLSSLFSTPQSDAFIPSDPSGRCARAWRSTWA